ncbi:MAG: anti-phage ZorAB system protein ZorA [Rhodocyclaceae bacterium]|nr:anti-phage ZorAB system protein ZorA [Rhodocyclaceae bacterium]
MNAPLVENFLQYWYVWIIGNLLLAIAVGFAVRFVLPARRIGAELAAAIAALQSIKAADPAVIAREAMTSERLGRVWADYAETLHPQPGSAERPDGVRWRATALAETFFTEQALVDSPLKTEFYKHLPGILTGLGIIGTFTGLIIGLVHFDVSLDPAQAQAQLRNLINSVGHAFFVSAFAITLAMLFTWIEKSLLTARYRQVEALRERVDGLFEVGADVEYLERLVLASETSATQAVHIKDALADQLRGILTELTARQMEASARHGAQLAADLGRVIGERLGQPIADIARAVDSVGARQDEVVNKMMAEVLAGFSAQMRNMFTGQMQAMNELLQRTDAAVAASGERQQAMDRQLDEFVGRMAGTVAESQSRSGAMLEQTLARLGAQVAAVVGQLQEQARGAAAVQQEQTAQLSHQAGEAMAGMSGQVERLIARSIEASHALQATVDKLSAATGTAVAGMNTGADTLAVAADDFAKAGQGVATTLDATAAAMENINFASNALLSASAVTQKMLENHGSSHAAFAALVADLRATIETARREASLSAELVDRLQAAAGQLSNAQHQSEAYLDKVNDVLIRAHQSFADNIERTLRESNRQFQKELAQAVSLLSGAIQDLGDTLDELPARRTVKEPAA